MLFLYNKLNFNSQPHKEADIVNTYDKSNIHISTHSLTRRLTISIIFEVHMISHFNSQPHKEADKTWMGGK